MARPFVNGIYCFFLNDPLFNVLNIININGTNGKLTVKKSLTVNSIKNPQNTFIFFLQVKCNLGLTKKFTPFLKKSFRFKFYR